MKKLAATLVMILALPAGAAEIDMDKAISDCQRSWPDDFTMQEYCISTQEEAAATLAKRDFDLPEASRKTVIATCYSKWLDDPKMVLYCLETQEEAAIKLAIPLEILGIPKDVAVSIVDRCTGRWQPDLKMIEYCRSQQADAWKRLNGG